MKKSTIRVIQNFSLILLGNMLYALAVIMFIVPAGLITGGSTGLALFFQGWLGVPLTLFIAVFNGAMFLLGAAVLGRAFALATLASTIFYPLALGLFDRFPILRGMTDDPLLSAIYAGILIGVAIGIVIKAGASTGGMDIPPLVLNRKFGFPISVMLYAFDTVILLTQMLRADREQVLYGILLVLIYTVVLDKVLLIGRSGTRVEIVTAHYEEINRMIIERLDRGSTLIHAESGYQRKPGMLVLSVVSNREAHRLCANVAAIDPDAFMIISRVNEIRGRGFSREKRYE